MMRNVSEVKQVLVRSEWRKKAGSLRAIPELEVTRHGLDVAEGRFEKAVGSKVVGGVTGASFMFIRQSHS